MGKVAFWAGSTGHGIARPRAVGVDDCAGGRPRKHPLLPLGPQDVAGEVGKVGNRPGGGRCSVDSRHDPLRLGVIQRVLPEPVILLGTHIRDQYPRE